MGNSCSNSIPENFLKDNNIHVSGDFFNQCKSNVYTETYKTIINYNPYTKVYNYHTNALGHVDHNGEESIDYLFNTDYAEMILLVEFLKKRFINLEYYFKGNVLFIKEKPYCFKGNVLFLKEKPYCFKYLLHTFEIEQRKKNKIRIDDLQKRIEKLESIRIDVT